MQLILPGIYSLIFLLIIFRWRFFTIPGLSRKALAGLFLLKLAAGVAVSLVYTYHYSTSDFYEHFSDSGIFVQNLLGDDFQVMQGWYSNFDPVVFNSSRTMILVNVALRIFSFGNFFVHIVFFCFFSFFGSVALLKAFLRHFPSGKIRLIIAIFLIPTVLFWGSSMLKEGFAIALTGLIVYLSDFGLKQEYKRLEIITGLIFFLLLLFVKMYVAFAIMPVIAINAPGFFITIRNTWIRTLFVFLVFSGAAFFIAKISPRYNLLELLSDKRTKAISEAKGGVFLVSERNFISVPFEKQKEVLRHMSDSTFRVNEGSSFQSWPLENMSDTTYVVNASDTSSFILLYSVEPANSVIPLKKIPPRLSEFLIHTPEAVMNVLFRPALSEISSWLHLVVAIENMWLILTLILAVIAFNRSVLEKSRVLLFCFIFSLLIFVLIGLTSPVLGAIVRYRTVGLLFFVAMILLLIDEEKLLKKLKLKK